MACQDFGDPSYMYAFALARTVEADLFLQSLGQTAAGLVPPVITPIWPNPGLPPQPVTAPLPTLANITWTIPTPPSSFLGTLSVDQYLPGPFTVTAPTLDFGSPPTPFTEAPPTSPAVNLSFTYPSLSITLPTPPSLLTLRDVPWTGFTMPTIDSTIPELTISPPTIIPYSPGAPFTSALLTELESTLQDRITNGTWTGLPADVETALWDRAREREYRQQADALAELERMENLGYAFPPGVFIDARIKIQTETDNSIAALSREIMVKQAELILSNIQKALEISTDLEGKLIQYMNQREQRAFEATKYATEAGIEIYNAQVRAYTALLDAFRTKAVIYEAQVRGAIATVEAYRIQIEAERAKADIDVALVQMYKTQMDAVLAQVEVYKAQLTAIQIQADVEKLKVEVFGEQIKAYVGEINAYTANVEAYKALVQTQGEKVGAFKAIVDAYVGQVTAGVKEAEAKIEEFKGLIAAKELEWDGFKAMLTSMAEQARAASYYNQAEASVYSAEVGGISAYNETLTKQWQVAYEQAQRTTEIGVAAAKANAELYMTTRSLALDAAKVGAQVSAQLGAAALSAVHWQQSSGCSTSYSESTSHITQNSVSTQDINETIQSV